MGDHGARQLSAARRKAPLRRCRPGPVRGRLWRRGPRGPAGIACPVGRRRGRQAGRRRFQAPFPAGLRQRRSRRGRVPQDGPARPGRDQALALDTLAKTADATELSEEELDAWLRALNYIRLWLGTLLDIREDDPQDEPEDPAHLLYYLLTAWQELVVSVLSGED